MQGSIPLASVNGDDRLNQLTPVCIWLAVFFAVFPLLRVPGYFFTLSDALFVVSGFLLVIRRRSVDISQLPLSRPTVSMWMAGVALLAAGLGASSLLSGNPDRIVVVLSQYGFAYLFVPWILTGLTREDVTKLGRYYLVGIGLVAISGGFVYYVGGEWADPFIASGDRIGSFFGNPNRLAKMIAVSLPLWFYAWQRRWMAKSVLLAILFSFFMGLLVAASFGGWLSTLGGLVVFLILLGDLRFMARSLASAVVAAGAYALIFGLPQSLIHRFSPFLTSGDLDEAGSFGIKVELMKEAWSYIAQAPWIGMGIDVFRQISELGKTVHDTYLLLWVEGGIFAILGWLLMLATLVWLAFRAWRQSKHRLVGATALATLSVFAANAITNTHMYARFWAIPVCIAVMLVVYELASDSGETTDEAGESTAAAEERAVTEDV